MPFFQNFSDGDKYLPKVSKILPIFFKLALRSEEPKKSNFTKIRDCRELSCSAPTLISRPKSVKSGLNPDQNPKKTRPNPDPI